MKYFLFLLICAGVMVALNYKSPTPSISSSVDEKVSTPAECTEPENPYDEDSGHSAGFEWAQENNTGSCGGNSDSFIEGCEEYQSQEDKYEQCEAKQ
jgi:hypothetical protein